MLQDSQYAWQSTDPAPVRSTSKAVPAKEKEASWLECYKPLAAGARRRRVNARARHCYIAPLAVTAIHSCCDRRALKSVRQSTRQSHFTPRRRERATAQP